MKNILYLILILILISCSSKIPKSSSSTQTLRFASYNVALFRSEAGGLAKDLNSGRDTQIQNVAAVIQHINPDVIALMEFDYDPSGALLDAFQKNYLGIGQQGEQAVFYKYKLSIPSNTGLLSGFDYNNDGKVALPDDGFGFGRYEGQYAFAILSKYPIDEKNIRSFQKMKWSAMPNAMQPVNADETTYYDTDEWESFRVSSKNHIDIPVVTPGDKVVHIVLAHPTPPVFDGYEDRNGLRNYEEIRLLKDYVSNADYLVDDKGQKGGLAVGASFVIMGDLNADPVDGDSYLGAINQLLDYSGINSTVTTGALIPKSNGGKIYNKSKNDKGDPAFDTSFFGKRIDYVLPSADFKVLDSGVFWPAEGEVLYEQVKDKKASDHLLVWVEVQ
jgi:endonuclease/exonuclease/phosphatase family metal-dependent hydrolase